MRTIALGLLLILVALALLGAAFVVPEWDQVIIVRLGKPVGTAITDPGLYFKVPFIDTIHRFDKRFLEWDGNVTEIPTKEKRNIKVDTYARWRITDPLLFYTRFKNELGAQTRLDGILNGETRDAVARHDLAELIRTTDREPAETDAILEEDGMGKLEPIEIGREAIRQEILDNSQARVEGLGIEILDVQFKRINYVEDVQRSVYDRMVAERRRIAERYRSEGEGEASRIRGDMEKDLKEIRSGAYRQAQEIIGEADAKATQIYASAYDRSADTRSFYAFLRTMESYSATFDRDTWILLGTEGEFYRYLESSGL